MKKVLPLIAILLVFASCGNAKKTARTTPEDRIVNHARAFSGTPYAWEYLSYLSPRLLTMAFAVLREAPPPPNRVSSSK